MIAERRALPGQLFQARLDVVLRRVQQQQRFQFIELQLEETARVRDGFNPASRALLDGRAVDTSLSATFDGEWKNGLLDGHVLMVANSGARFDGQYIRGKRNGPGLETFADGSARRCNWVDDVAQEPCTRITAEGKVIEDRRRR